MYTAAVWFDVAWDQRVGPPPLLPDFGSINCLSVPPDFHPLPSALDWCIQQQSGLMLLGRWSIGDLPAGIPFLAFSKCKQKNMDMRKRNTYAHPTVSNIFDNWKMVFCYKNCSDLL